MKTENVERTVIIHHCFDPDSSPEDYFRDQDQKRLDSWKNDEWHFIGIYVEVTTKNWTTGVTTTVRSPGLWSIESDSDKDYLQSVAQEELDQLELNGLTLDDAEVLEHA